MTDMFRFGVASLTLVLLGFFLGWARVVKASELEGCNVVSGCMKCEISNCPVLQEGEWYQYVNTTTAIRCVEYDHVPPSHCASLTQAN